VTELLDARLKCAREAWFRALHRVAPIERHPTVTLPVLIDELADRHESSPALISSEATLTYRALAQRCNQYARWGMLHGLKSGDTVCLVMENCAEYLAVWLGLTRIGVIVALANTHLSGESLAHAINIVSPKLILVGASKVSVLRGACDALPAKIPCWVRGRTAEDVAPIEPDLFVQPDATVMEAQGAASSIDTTALLIYTSGTTGLPKAAKVSHRRVMQWSHWFAGLMDTGPQDRMYDCLPLYHSVGGVVATGAMLVAGGAVVLRERFSASHFWHDIRQQRCTLFQYIGELCRYLVNAPHDADEAHHALRLACGNGLRADIWRTFETRFRIPRILEYYAATEGTFSLYNCEGEPGAIGRIPPYLRQHLPVELLRFDVDRGEPWRDAEGFCRRCDVNEVGEAVGMGRFDGYVDSQASAAKILEHVFTAGDAWYRSGDLMRCDERGFYYFVDRVGDTYRWKGENVSTTEVLAALKTMPGVLDAVVYGVSVPGADGRAGMAALVIDARFDLGHFRSTVAQRLPAYARPAFLRLLPRLETTSTFKPIIRELVGTSFNPALVADPLYVDSPAARAYVALDPATYAAVLSGDIRL
jgi:fatty-acyl-CoA synthase